MLLAIVCEPDGSFLVPPVYFTGALVVMFCSSWIPGGGRVDRGGVGRQDAGGHRISRILVSARNHRCRDAGRVRRGRIIGHCTPDLSDGVGGDLIRAFVRLGGGVL